MTTTDLYSDIYLGELETTIIEKNSLGEIISELRLCSGDFGSIVELIPFNQSSNIESIVYLYNMDLNWGIDFTQITRIQEFYDQLISISNQVNTIYLPALNALKQIFLSTIQNNNILFIKHRH